MWRCLLDEHLEEITENVIAEHLFNNISIATVTMVTEHLGFFSTVLIVKLVWLLGKREYM